MKKIFLAVFLSIFSITGFSQKLSENASISLITIAPGNDLYSVFGHTAIRVQDSVLQIDKAYNYGTFDFDDPNFYVKFVKGDLNYMISDGNFQYFLQYYISENRSVTEQKLNLSQLQKQQLFDFLEWNLLPENKFYLYDFFFQNCATVVRDVFEKQLSGSISFRAEDKNYTFRNMLHQYLGEDKEWNKLGIDLILGARADKIATPREYMFLPDYLMYATQTARLKTDSATFDFAQKSETLFQSQKQEISSQLPKPVTVFWLLFAGYVLVTIWGFVKKKRLYGFDFVWLLGAGIGGFILFFAWFFTNHTITVNNYNLIWLLVTHFVFAFFLFGKKKSGFYKGYLLINGSLNVLLLLLWFVIPQELNSWIIPLVLTFAQRFFYLYFFDKIKL